MASSSSSTSSFISFESESSREPSPEYDPIAVYEILAPCIGMRRSGTSNPSQGMTNPSPMMKTSHFFLDPSWRRTTKKMLPGTKNSPPRKKKLIPPQPKKTQ
jgi:hypothetical protein